MALASHWLSRCITSHEGCKKNVVGAKMPTRLLQLGPEDVRLCITDASKPTLPYMTLSHCWGSAQFLKLTIGTCQRLMDGLPLYELPQTFQDTVHVAQRLGVQYLWIDSLCIYQDSESDWQAEASTMSDVYKGSLCNIAATASYNSRGGLFRSRDPRYLPCCIVTTQYTECANETYHLMEHESNRHYIDEYLYSNQPLLSRGWVVQERLLAPRVLHFGEFQAFWECHEDVYCEAYPHGVPIHSPRQMRYKPPPKMSNPDVIALNYAVSTGEEGGGSQEARRAIYDFWERIVVMYSRCNLTKGDDKLIAISGMAENIHGDLGKTDRYLGGLWYNDLFAQLAWYLQHPTKARPEPYRAPTWSWASMDGAISYLSDRYLTYWRDFTNTIVGFDVDNLSPDEFGRVRSGIIRITGPMKTLTCLNNPVKGDRPYWEPKFHWKLKTTHPYEGGPTHSAPSAYWDVANEPEESSLVDENKEIHRLHWMPFFPKNTRTANVFGLILQPTGVSKGQFKRLGILGVMGTQLQMNMDMSRLATPDPQDSWLEYEDFDGTNYTISIV